MAAAFQDIGITDLSVAPLGDGEHQDGIRSITLKLSPSPSSTWHADFNQRWESHFYMQKRNARGVGSGLQVQCTLHEIRGELLAEIKKVMAQSNEACRHLEMETRKAQAAKAAAAELDAKAIEELKRNIKFD